MKPALWTAADAQNATGGTPVGGAGWTATGISFDTRSLEPGDLFVALQGETADGHAHVADAFAKGAAAALVSRADIGGGPLLVVPDTLAAFGDLGRAARARASVRALAITGSVGKTGTKEAVARALALQAPTHAARASFNNHIGVPATLARLPRDAVYGVFEVGMNHAGEIAPLARMIRPHAAMITTVEAVHTEAFADGIAGVAAAKAEIFAAGGPAAAVLPRDNAFFGFLSAQARAAGFDRLLSFGESAGADSRLVDWRAQGDGGRARVELFGKTLDFAIGAPGIHWARNLAGALLSIAALGADAEAAAANFADLAPPKGRGARHVVDLPGGGTFLLIDDSYNASPPSMRAAFAVLAEAPVGARGRRVAVLGDMRELGPQAAEMHAGLAPAIAQAGIARVHCCGPLMKTLYEALPEAARGHWAPDSAALEPRVLADVAPGDALVVKGSLGSKMGRIVEALRAAGGAAATGRKAAGGR
jgi:UDP-N-acetylmuramoyl-tripeptide--D-alanyl-D-alanine ligase